MKNFMCYFVIAVFVLCQLSCSSEENPKEIDNLVTADTTEIDATEPLNITEDTQIHPIAEGTVFQTMSAADTEKLSDKTPLQIITVLEGTNRVAIEARFRGVRDFGFGFPLYECELMNEAVEEMGGIAAGMSGSPVGPPGRIMGALAYGDSWSKSPTRFWVTDIEAMEDARNHETLGDLREAQLAEAPSAQISSVYTPVKIPLMITGIQPHRLEKLQHQLKDLRFEFMQLFADARGIPAAPATGSTKLAAGDMIGIGVTSGDIVNATAFGTVTQVYDDGTFIAFGHSMDGKGKANLPVYKAVVNGIVPNYQSAYKSASISGNPIGTMTKDLSPGIVGELGTIPDMIPVELSYQLGNGKVIKKNHEVAYGQEHFIPLVAALTIDAIRQEINSSTMEATVELSFKETNTRYMETTWNTSTDPTLDLLINMDRMISAFTDLYENSVEKATLTEVSITVKDKPEMQLATIHEVVVPDDFTLGESATISITVFPHWSATAKQRKITKQVTLNIPSDWETGGADLTVEAEYPDGIPNPFDALFDFDFDFDLDVSEAETPPENLDQLINDLEANQVTEPGKITITLTSDDYDTIDTEIIIDDFIVIGEHSDFVFINE